MTENSKVFCLAVAILLMLAAPAMAIESEISNVRPESQLTPQAVTGGSDELIGADVPRFGPSRFGPVPQPPGDTAGLTYYDFQHNGSMGRQIAYTPDLNGHPYIHFVWMWRNAPGATRYIRYNARKLSAPQAWIHRHGDDNAGTSFSGANGGYTTIDVNSEGAAIASWHEGLAGFYFTYAGKDLMPPNTPFSKLQQPAPPNCEGEGEDGYELESEYLWPVIEYDNVDGNDVYHVISTENPGGDPIPPAATIQSFIYYRIVNDTTDECTGTSTDTLGRWMTEDQNITPVVRSDPGSDKVAIVYLKDMYPDPNHPNNDCEYTQWQHDVAYFESNDGGVTWDATPTNITNYSDGGTLAISEIKYMAYTDVTALYDHLGTLHIVWNTPVWPAAGACEGSYYTTMMWHWDDFNQEITPVYDATMPFLFRGPGGTFSNTGVWNIMTSKPNISECDERLYVSFTRFGAHPDTTMDPAMVIHDSVGGDYSDLMFLNGDIFLTGSSDGGITWGPDAAAPPYDYLTTGGTGTAVKTGTAVNVTNTRTDDCVAGDCHSEHWSSMAKYSTDVVHIAYIDDNHPGAAVVVDAEGEYTNNAYMYMTYPCFEPEGTFDYRVDPSSAFVPIAPNGVPDCTIEYTDDFTITITNAGNVPINYTFTSDQSWLNPASGSGTITAGINPTADVVMTVGPIGAEGEYPGTVTIDLTSSAGSASGIVVDVTAHVECLYYVPEYALISTHCWSVGVWNVPRAGLAQRNDEGNMWWFVEDVAPMYDEGLILTYAEDVSQTFFSMFDGSDSDASFIAMGPLTVTDHSTYEQANGLWATPDSVITGTIDWYTPKHPVYCVLIERVVVCNNSDAAITIHLGEGIDWDFPDGDDGSDNNCGVDTDRQMVYQHGPTGSSPYEDYHGGASFCVDIVGTIVLENDVWVYPNSGYIPADIGNLLATHTGFVAPNPDPAEDLNSVYVIAQNLTLDAQACTTFCKVKASSLTSLLDLQNLIDKGKEFIADTPEIDCPGCVSSGPDCVPGDANGSGGVDIDDVVYLINYIFGGGPPPVQDNCCGDANGSGGVDIDDVVYLINYIFGGGPPPVDIC